MRFSVTEIEGYKYCKRLGQFTSFNGQGMGNLLPPNYFTTGTIWHDGHHRWLLEPEKIFTQCMLEAIKDQVEKVEARYEARLGFKMLKDESTYLWNSCEELPFMAENYQRVWKTPLPEGYHLVAPEQTIIVKIPGSQHELELTVDALIQHEDADYLLIIERKTYKARPRLIKLQKNNQFLRYMVGCRLAGLGDVRGIGYDGAWKRKGPTRKDMTLEDMFTRTTILRKPYEIANEVAAIAYDINEMANDPYYCNTKENPFYIDPDVARKFPNEIWFHPSYYVNPLMGCSNCSIQDLCEAYREGNDWVSIYETRYGPREKQGYALVTQEDEE